MVRTDARHYSDPDACEAALRRARWPGGPRCPACGGAEIVEIRTVRVLRCRGCRRKISPRRGTIMEDSPIPTGAWLAVVWAAANGEDAVGSARLAEAIGVTPKTAWSMRRRIRAAMEIDGATA